LIIEIIKRYYNSVVSAIHNGCVIVIDAQHQLRFPPKFGKFAIFARIYGKILKLEFPRALAGNQSRCALGIEAQHVH
jgi:hypothetical protein